MALLTHQEAIWFLQEVLKISSIKQKLSNDKHGLLDEIIDRFQQTIPFQSVTVISQLEANQHLPTMENTKTQIVSTQGGLCYDLNIFMRNLLEVLGYEVYFNACDIGLDGIHDHVSVLVRNLVKSGDNYFVDVGCGDPLFQAIPLDFDKESPVYKCGYKVYKFVKEGKEISVWHEIDASSPKAAGIVTDGWLKQMSFTLESIESEYFTKHMIKHYVAQTPLVSGYTFLRNMRADMLPNQKLIAIRGISLFRENSDGMINKTKIKSNVELVELYGKYFPQIPTDLVRMAADKMEYNFDRD